MRSAIQLGTTFLVFFVLLFTSAISQADVIFSPAISYSKEKKDVSGAQSEDSRIAYDFRLGWVHDSGLYLGGMYTMTEDGEDADMTGIAPAVGYVNSYGFYAFFSYFVNAEYKTSTTKLVDGMGPQIDLGWVFPLTKSFYIGPQMSYRSVGYDKVEAGGTSVSTDTTHTEIAPYVVLWFKF